MIAVLGDLLEVGDKKIEKIQMAVVAIGNSQRISLWWG
jgi:hypothetical protein